MFEADRALLNPKFEGYKLDPLEQDSHVFAFPLDRRVSQTAAAVSKSKDKGKGRAYGYGQVHLGFEEMRSRIRHNHLYPGLGGQACWFDEDGGVNLVRLEGDEPNVKRICELPVPMDTEDDPSSSKAFKEYPSALALSQDLWFISDGTGRAYILSEANESDHIIASYEFRHNEEESTSSISSHPTPFMLWTSRPYTLHPNSEATILISTTHRSSSPPTLNPPAHLRPKPNHKHSFRIHAIFIPVPPPAELRAVEEIQTILPLWSLEARDLPLHAEYSAADERFMILSSKHFSKAIPASSPMTVDSAPSTPGTEDPPPILGSNPSPSSEPEKPPPPPPYTWTQTNDSLTITFGIPSLIPTSSISVIFARKALSILIKTDGIHLEIPGWKDMLPKFALRELWGEIKQTECVWTFDKEGDRNSNSLNSRWGLLSLHIEKKDEGTRWPQVFAHTNPSSNSPSKSDAPDPYMDVPELLDPSELASIREMLEKYTSPGGLMSEQMGLGSGIPSLATGEVDEEVDSDVGRKVYVQWFGPDGESAGDGGGSVDCLSLAMPSARTSDAGARSREVVIKRNVDGLLYTSPSSSSQDEEDKPKWIHKSTIPALAFVLASKRDTRFTYHLSSRAVFAFDSGSSASSEAPSRFVRSSSSTGGGGGNVYIYKNAGKSKHGKQVILGICSGGDGMGGLVGVVAFEEGGETRVLCLFEKGLKVLRDLGV